MRIIFLDIDGVLNCELHYAGSQFSNYKEAKRSLKKQVKKKEIERMEYYQSQICTNRMLWLNELCVDVKAKVVISSTWRMGKSVEELQEILNYCGATFNIVGKTDACNCRNRGCEINKWAEENNTNDYVIIDDDSDMLLSQRDRFFQTDSYAGLTPNVCYRIKRFFGETNDEPNVQASVATDDDKKEKP